MISVFKKSIKETLRTIQENGSICERYSECPKTLGGQNMQNFWDNIPKGN